MKPPVPLSAKTWAPAPPGTVLRRPALLPERAPAPPEPDQFEGVEYLACRVCGWRWGKNPTRCMCPHAEARTAPPVRRETHWSDR